MPNPSKDACLTKLYNMIRILCPINIDLKVLINSFLDFHVFHPNFTSKIIPHWKNISSKRVEIGKFNKYSPVA